jgi:predicted nuclease of predicted toxin-antitoxin system
MKLLLDQGLPRSAAGRFRERGIDATHAADVGLSSAADADILDRAREMGCTVVTLDSDFHAILALSGALAPSVIRIRIEGLDGAGVEALIRAVISACGEEIESGAAISVTETAIRLRSLPILTDPNT